MCSGLVFKYTTLYRSKSIEDKDDGSLDNRQFKETAFDFFS